MSDVQILGQNRGQDPEMKKGVISVIYQLDFVNPQEPGHIWETWPFRPHLYFLTLILKSHTVYHNTLYFMIFTSNPQYFHNII